MTGDGCAWFLKTEHASGEGWGGGGGAKAFVKGYSSCAELMADRSREAHPLSNPGTV